MWMKYLYRNMPFLLVKKLSVLWSIIIGRSVIMKRVCRDTDCNLLSNYQLYS